MGTSEPQPYGSVEFEVFGKVQGCYFTKHCKELCEKLKVSGWVKNSKRGTIQGRIQGPKDSIDKMIDWLSNEGSPGCQIERCELTNWETVSKPDFKGFSIRF